MPGAAVDTGGSELVERYARYAGSILEDHRCVLVGVRNRSCLRRKQQNDQNSIGWPPRFSEKPTHKSDYIPKSHNPKILDPASASELQNAATI